MASYTNSYTETAVLNDSLTSHIRQFYCDDALMDDQLGGGMGTKYVETAVLNDSLGGFYVSRYVESAVLNDSLGGPIIAKNRYVEVAVLDDQTSARYRDSVTEIAVLNDSAGVAEAIVTRYLEAAVLNDSLRASDTMVDRYTERAVLNDRLDASIVTKVIEAAVLNDSLAARALSFLNRVIETAVLNDSLAGTRVLCNKVIEYGLLNDQASSIMVALSSFTDVGVLNDYLVQAPTGDAWAAPTDIFAMSRYSNFPFNSMASVNGFFIGANGLGLYLLDGHDDAGTKINAALVGDLTDSVDGAQGPAGDPRLRRPHTGWFSYSSEGTLRFVLSCTGTGAEVRYEYEMPARAALDMTAGRVKLGRGLRGRYFRHGFENVDGADFSLNDGRIHYDMLQRRA